jgi:hypothetical protein
MYRFIENQQGAHSIELLCQTLKISRSAWYAWHKGDSYRMTAKDKREEERVVAVFNAHRRRYGARRVVAELQAQGLEIGYYKVRSIMRKYELKAIQRQRPTAALVCPSYYR